MSQSKIIAYLKPTCGWSQGVRAVLAKYSLPYEDKDIINSFENREEMIRKSGQPLSPCVEIDGKMLPDISGEELEELDRPPTASSARIRCRCRRPPQPALRPRDGPARRGEDQFLGPVNRT